MKGVIPIFFLHGNSTRLGSFGGYANIVPHGAAMRQHVHISHIVLDSHVIYRL